MVPFFILNITLYLMGTSVVSTAWKVSVQSDRTSAEVSLLYLRQHPQQMPAPRSCLLPWPSPAQPRSSPLLMGQGCTALRGSTSNFRQHPETEIEVQRHSLICPMAKKVAVYYLFTCLFILGHVMKSVCCVCIHTHIYTQNKVRMYVICVHAHIRELRYRENKGRKTRKSQR